MSPKELQPRVHCPPCLQSPALHPGQAEFKWVCCSATPYQAGLCPHSATCPTGERREGVNASVSSDVQSVFKGKTYNQLQVIFQGIEGKIRAGGPNLDMGYWESLLQQLRAHMARAR